MESTRMTFWHNKIHLMLGLLVLAFLFTPTMAYAAGVQGPWNSVLVQVVQWFVGLAYPLVIIGLVVLCAMLIFVREWSHFAQGILIIVICGTTIAAATTIAQATGIAGAVI